MIPLDEFQEALDRIRPHVEVSPLRYSDWLSQALDAEVYLKLECLHPGRSFKIRGATNTLLSQDPPPAQVLTASGGNHGLGVTIAAKRLDIPCRVILPTSTSSYRVELLRMHGADVELQGSAWDEANDYALNLAKSDEVLYIHPFADRSVMVGQGTIALELADQLPEYEVLMASVGGGGLLGGISLAVEALHHQDRTQIFAVETRGTDSLSQSLASGGIVELSAITSIAKTLGAKQTTPFILETMKRLLSGNFVVSDRDAVQFMLSFLDQEKILIEPATSCIIAAAMENPQPFQGKRCVFIICGSNVTYGELLSWQNQFDVEYSVDGMHE